MALERVKIWIAGEILTASDLNTEFDNIVDYVNTLQDLIDTNSSDIATLQTDVNDINADILDLQGQIDDTNTDLDNQIDTVTTLINDLVPIGTIIPFYNYNNLVSYNADYWQLMNGETIDDALSPFDTQVATDMSGRYMVGFGTDGDENMGTDPWSVTPAGNAAHQIDIRHNHSSASHSHSSASHSHGAGTLKFKVAESTSTVFQFYTSGGTATTALGQGVITFNQGGISNASKSWSTGTWYTDSGSGTGSTDSTTPGSTGSTTPGSTGNNLSTTQSIQPRSIRVYYLLRKR